MTVTVSNLIRTKRQEAGLSQEGLAKAVGVSRLYVSFLERATRRPSSQLWQRICMVLKIQDIPPGTDIPRRKSPERQNLRSLGVCLNGLCPGLIWDGLIPRRASAQIPDDRYCQFCGTELSIAHHCGHDLSPSLIYCPGCGDKIADVRTTEPANPPPPRDIDVDYRWEYEDAEQQKLKKTWSHSGGGESFYGESFFFIDNDPNPSTVDEVCAVLTASGIYSSSPRFRLMLGEISNITTKKNDSRRLKEFRIDVAFYSNSTDASMRIVVSRIERGPSWSAKFELNFRECERTDVDKYLGRFQFGPTNPIPDVLLYDASGSAARETRGETDASGTAMAPKPGLKPL